MLIKSAFESKYLEVHELYFEKAYQREYREELERKYRKYYDEALAHDVKTPDKWAYAQIGKLNEAKAYYKTYVNGIHCANVSLEDKEALERILESGYVKHGVINLGCIKDASQ